MSDLTELQLKYPNVIFGSSDRNIPGINRSSKWPEFLAGIIERNPRCIICHTVHGLTGHHVIPVHIDPELELIESNIAVVCQVDHFLIGHLRDWRSWNADFWKWVSAFRDRPYSPPKKRGGSIDLLSETGYDQEDL